MLYAFFAFSITHSSERCYRVPRAHHLCFLRLPSLLRSVITGVLWWHVQLMGGSRVVRHRMLEGLRELLRLSR
jgi:hypothetical protein